MSVPNFDQPANLAAEQTVEDTNAWVAQFAPLVMSTSTADVPEIKNRLDLIKKLSDESETLRSRLNEHGLSAPPELVETFESAVSQLDSIETDYRKRLAKLAPGDPGGIANLNAVQQKLEQRAARQELGVSTEDEIPSVLELKTSPGSWAAAGGLAVFGLGWTAFTTVHAVLMIGGMWQAFGPGALLLLAFYSIFFFAGFAMLAGAFNAGATENITLNGTELTVRKKLGIYNRAKTYHLDAAVKGRVDTPVKSEGSSKSIPGPAIILTDIEGRPVSVAAGATPALRDQICEKINAYLTSQAEA